VQLLHQKKKTLSDKRASVHEFVRTISNIQKLVRNLQSTPPIFLTGRTVQLSWYNQLSKGISIWGSVRGLRGNGFENKREKEKTLRVGHGRGGAPRTSNGDSPEVGPKVTKSLKKREGPVSVRPIYAPPGRRGSGTSGLFKRTKNEEENSKPRENY